MAANPFKEVGEYSIEDGFNSGGFNMPLDGGTLFNERGYNKSSSIAVDAEEMISEYNGGLFYKIPLYNFKGPGDLRADLSLTYSSGINHTIFSAGQSSAGSGLNYCQFNYGFPQWILNLNGVAVQTLSFETNMLTDRTNSGNDFTQGNEVRCLINGYHLTNEIQYPGDRVYDKIYLLQGDGSIDTLRNCNPNYNSYGYTDGNYKSQERGVFSRGKVEFIVNPGTEIFRLRRLYYMKGDGLIYTYEEVHVNYNVDSPTPYKEPKVFILKTIKDRYGNSLELEYEDSNPGRPLLLSINCNWDNSSPINIYYPEMLTDTKKITITNLIKGNFELSLDQKIGFDSTENHITRITSIKNPVNQTLSFGYEEYKRRMVEVKYGVRLTGPPSFFSKILLDKLKRITSFTNYFGGKASYIYKLYPEELVMDYSRLGDNEFPTTLESESFEYYIGPGRDVFFVNMIVQKLSKSNSDALLKKENYYYDFTLSTTEYPYPKPFLHVSRGTRYTNSVHELDYIATTKEIESIDDTNLFGTSKKIQILKIFKAYKTLGYQFNFSNKDYSSEIKCESEIYKTWNTSNSNWNPLPYLTKEIGYFIGTPVDIQKYGLYFTGGSFLLFSKIERSPSGGINDHNYSYVHKSKSTEQGDIFLSDHINLNPPIEIRHYFPNTTKIIKYFKVFYREFPTEVPADTEYPFLKGEFNPTTGATQYYDNKIKYFYLLNVKVREEFKDNNNKGKYESFNYREKTDNFGYIGQMTQSSVLKESNYAISLVTTYDYARKYTLGKELYFPQNHMPSIEGNLIKIVSPNGNVQKYYYHPFDEIQSELDEPSPQEDPVPSVKIKIALDNGTIYNGGEKFQDRRFPTRIDVFPNGESGSEAYLLKKYQLFDGSGNITQSISPNGFISVFVYDKINRILKLTTPYDFSTIELFNDSQKYTNKYEYNDSSRLTTVLGKINTNTDKKTENFFDEFYKLIISRQFKDSSNYNEFKTYYNYLDEKSKTVDALNYSTKFSYDGNGNLKIIVNEDGSSSIIETSYVQELSNYWGVATYNMFFKKIVSYDEEGFKTERYFDGSDNLIREIKYIPNERDAPVLKDIGLVEDFVPFKALQTDYYYEANDRLTKVITPDGKPIDYFYDGFGRLIQVITRDSGTTRYLYDNNSNLVYSQSSTQGGYPSNPDNTYTFYSYDKANRILGTGQAGIPMDGYPEFPSIDPEEKYFFNEVSSSLDSPSNLNEYLIYNVYDKLSNSPGGFLTPPDDYNDFENYTMGQIACIAFRTRVTDNWNFKYFRYDARGRVIRMWIILDDIGLKIFDYEYNSLNQITYLTVNPHDHGRKFQYGYDKLGRLINTNLEESGPPPDYFYNLVSYAYNANSLINTTSLNNTDSIISNTYDNRNRIIRIDDAEKLLDYNLEYYSNNNVKKQIIFGNYRNNFTDSKEIGFEFLYDTASRLRETKKLTSADYFNGRIRNTYDAEGNILTMIRDSNEDNFSYEYYTGTNRLRKVTGTEAQFDYDKNGNLLNDRLMKNYFMLYDYRNLLIEVKSGEPGDPPSFYYTRYWYDEAGNRVKKLVLNSLAIDPPYPNWNDPTGTGDWGIYETIHYLRDKSGKSLVEYKNMDLDFYNIWGVDLVGKVKNDGSKQYYFKDHVGSIRVTINDSNQMISAVDYDSWGNIIREWQPAEMEYKFSSKERDFESTYDYFGARNLSARIGRWIQIDPKMSKHYDLTPYNYVLNNPLTLIDPDGRQEGASAANPIPALNSEFEQIPKYINDIVQKIEGLAVKAVEIEIEIIKVHTAINIAFTVEVAAAALTGFIIYWTPLSLIKEPVRNFFEQAITLNNAGENSEDAKLKVNEEEKKWTKERSKIKIPKYGAVQLPD